MITDICRQSWTTKLLELKQVFFKIEKHIAGNHFHILKKTKKLYRTKILDIYVYTVQS